MQAFNSIFKGYFFHYPRFCEYYVGKDMVPFIAKRRNRCPDLGNTIFKRMYLVILLGSEICRYNFLGTHLDTMSCLLKHENEMTLGL